MNTTIPYPSHNDFDHTNNLITNTDRDVLKGTCEVIDTVKTGLTSTNRYIADTDRDVLKGNCEIIDTVKTGLNFVDRDVLQGTNGVNQSVKDSQIYLANDIMQNRAQSARGFASVETEIAKGNCDQTDTIKNSLHDVDKDIYKSAHHQMDHYDRQFLAAQNTASRYQSDLITQGTASTLALSLANKDIQLAIEKDIGSQKQQSEAIKASIQSNTAALALEQQKLAAIQQLQSQSGFSSVQLEAAKNYNGIQIEQLKIKDQLQHELASQKLASQKHFGRLHELQSTSTLRLELEAQKTKCEILSKIQECCCEQKEVTRSSAEGTNTLIRMQQEQNLRDKLADCRAINIATQYCSSGNGHGNGNGNK